MKALFYFLFGAFTVVVCEWLYLNFLKGSQSLSDDLGDSGRSKNSRGAESSGATAQAQVTNQSSAAQANTGSETASGSANASVVSTAKPAVRKQNPYVTSTPTVHGVSKGRAFLDRMAAKEETEKDSASSRVESKSSRVIEDKTSIATSAAFAKKPAKMDTNVLPHEVEELSAPDAGTADNLELVSGIGPKIAELLGESGIDSYEALAGTSIDDLTRILEAAGPRYALADVSSWSAQAAALYSSK